MVESPIKTLLLAWSLVTGMQAFAGCAHATGDIPVRWTPAEVSTDQYESSAVFASNGLEMYFMRADRNFDSYRILQSRCQRGRWTHPAEVAFSSAPGVHDADPFVTGDGRQLYFISTRHRYPEAGNDDFDIFVAERAPDGEWGTPVRLPGPINSRSSELFPRLGKDGTLYFGSSRPGGAGGSDIYSAKRTADGAWSIRNEASLNTPSNEYEAAISDDGTQIAVISDREGKSRLHLFELNSGQWVHKRRIRASEPVFQVGPSWSAGGRRLMFSQDAGEDSGEIFVLDTGRDPDPGWPPSCNAAP